MLNSRVPEFFVVGAAKSGTSALWEYLSRHSQIYIPVKEPSFFSDPEVYSLGFDWYTSLYSGATESQIAGDMSTGYSRWPHTLDSAALIASSAPNAKIIYILRHPAERVHAHYAHDMRNGVTLSFDEAVRTNEIYVDCSMYMSQLERYLEYYDRRSIKVLFQRDLSRDPERVLTDLQSFLGVANEDLLALGTIRKNITSSEYFIRSRTTERLLRHPVANRVANWLPPQLRRNLFRRMILDSPIGRSLDRRYRIPPMTPSRRAELLERLELDTQRLETFLGTKLEDWFQ